MEATEQFAELCRITEILLGENGCPWDKAQTHESLRQHLLEECYEVVDSIDNNDMPALCEELGDVLLHVLFHSHIAKKSGQADSFSLADVLRQVSEKLVSRHTHIFGGELGDEKTDTPDDVEKIWEANKQKEKPFVSVVDNMLAVPKAMPALTRAQKVVKRSEAIPPLDECFAELKNLVNIMEVKAKDASSEGSNMDEVGKILLLLVMISTKVQLNAEFSLTNAINTFINSFECTHR